MNKSELKAENQETTNKKYKISVVYEVSDVIEVEATNLKEAIELADREPLLLSRQNSHGNDRMIEYIDGTFSFNKEMIEFYNEKLLSETDKKILSAQSGFFSEIEDVVDRTATNFHIRITKSEAEYLLSNTVPFHNFEIMCKEYGEEQRNEEDEDWVGLCSDDLNEEYELDSDYKTFEIWLNKEDDKKEFINYLESLTL